MIERISVADGKYTFEFNYQTGEFICLRYGEPWREFVGDKAVYSLFARVIELQQEERHRQVLRLRADAIVAVQMLTKALEETTS